MTLTVRTGDQVIHLRGAVRALGGFVWSAGGRTEARREVERIAAERERVFREGKPFGFRPMRKGQAKRGRTR